MSGLKIVTTLWLLVLAICGTHLASAQRRALNAQRRAEQDIVNNLLDPNTYDSRLNPGGNETGSPTVVAVNFYVRQLDVVDGGTGEMKLQLTLRMEWNDPRLTYTRPNSDGKRKFITIEDRKKVWSPDYFIGNEKEAKLHMYARSNSYVRIFPNGNILISDRVSLTLDCPMTFNLFPFDSQTCPLKLASYGSTNQDIEFTWKSENPIQMRTEYAVGNTYALKELTTDYCNSETTTGVYSCLNAQFNFKRLVTYYTVQVFIPCTMLIIIGWLVFWLAPKDIIARLILVISTLFVLVILTARLNEQFPRVSYTKAIDIWTGTCLTFVFVALIETIIVNYLSRRESENGEDGTQTTGKGDGDGADDDVETQALKPETEEEKADEKQPKKKKLSSVQIYAKRYWSRIKIDQNACSQKTDIVFRIVYPIVFIVFTIIYSIVYCTN